MLILHFYPRKILPTAVSSRISKSISSDPTAWQSHFSLNSNTTPVTHDPQSQSSHPSVLDLHASMSITNIKAKE